MFVGSIFFAKNTKGMAKGPKKKPIIAQKLLFAPLLSAIKYNNPEKQMDNTSGTKYPIPKPFNIPTLARLIMRRVLFLLVKTEDGNAKEVIIKIYVSDS